MLLWQASRDSSDNCRGSQLSPASICSAVTLHVELHAACVVLTGQGGQGGGQGQCTNARSPYPDCCIPLLPPPPDFLTTPPHPHPHPPPPPPTPVPLRPPHHHHTHRARLPRRRPRRSRRHSSPSPHGGRTSSQARWAFVCLDMTKLVCWVEWVHGGGGQ